jgi:hypothetical protein
MHPASVVSPSVALASARKAWNTGLFQDFAITEDCHSRRIWPWQAPQKLEGRRSWALAVP